MSDPKRSVYDTRVALLGQCCRYRTVVATKKLKNAGLHCPHCAYDLSGVTELRCPECGERFNPDYLYSADYEYGLQWTGRRKLALVLGALAIVAGGIALLVQAGGAYSCMVVSLVGIGCVVWLGRRVRG